MPAHYVINVENRIVLTTFSGVLTLKDAAEQGTRLQHDPIFDSGFSELIDLNGVSEVALGYSEI